MTVGKVKDFDFGPAKVHVKGYCRGGPTKKYAEGGSVKGDLAQDKAMVKAAVHKHEKALHKGQPLTKLARGGGVAQGTKDATAVAGSRGSIPGVGRTPVPTSKAPDAMARAPMSKSMAPMRDPSMARASVKAPARRGVPVAPQSPLVAMKMGGMAKMRKC